MGLSRPTDRTPSSKRIQTKTEDAHAPEEHAPLRVPALERGDASVELFLYAFERGGDEDGRRALVPQVPTRLAPPLRVDDWDRFAFIPVELQPDRR